MIMSCDKKEQHDLNVNTSIISYVDSVTYFGTGINNN